MKAFVQFLNSNDRKYTMKAGKMSVETVPVYHMEACGSDGVFILDGRNNLDTMIDDAFSRMHTLRKVSRFSGFKIMRGDFKSSKCIYKYIK